jgi:hypothetical protein
VKLFVCSFPNDKSAPGRRPFRYFDEPHEIDAFAKQWDRSGWATYRCYNSLMDSAMTEGPAGRSIANVAAIEMIWADLDVLRDLDDTPANVLAQLETLSCKPTSIHNSGGGFHLFWELIEPIRPDTPGFKRARQAYEDLAEVLCAYPTVAHPAALLRCLDTHNSKRAGEPSLVERISGTGDPVSLDHIEEMVLQLRGRARPMFTRLNEEKTNGRAYDLGEHRDRAPLDIGAALEAMKHEGAGDTAVHLTQLKSTASLLNGGMATEEVVHEIMDATKRVGKPTWNYDEEERKVLKLCFDWISKNPNLAYLLPDDLRADFNTKIAAGCARISIRWLPFKKAWQVVGNGAETECPSRGLPPLLGGFVPYDGSDIAPAEWIIKGLLPATGVLILPGQWGTYKTTLEYEMALSIATGDAFAGKYKIKRPGAVMVYALEGEPKSNNRRMRAIAEFHGKGNPSLPIYWSRECPPLSHPNTVGEIVAAFNSVVARARAEYDMPVRVIWIDTYSIAAGHTLSGDDNDRAATQKCFNTLRKISQQTGVLVAVVDHFGKLQEAGTIGSSGKEGNADAVLANLGERQLSGDVSNMRLAVRKQRDGRSGFEIPFEPRVVDWGVADEDGELITGVALEFGNERAAQRTPTMNDNDRMLMRALDEAIIERGFDYYDDIEPVRACFEKELKQHFYAMFPRGDQTDDQRFQSRRSVTYTRALNEAIGAKRITLTKEGTIVYATT